MKLPSNASLSGTGVLGSSDGVNVPVGSLSRTLGADIGYKVDGCGLGSELGSELGLVVGAGTTRVGSLVGLI
jgi:hypothetical protein